MGWDSQIVVRRPFEKVTFEQRRKGATEPGENLVEEHSWQRELNKKAQGSSCLVDSKKFSMCFPKTVYLKEWAPRQRGFWRSRRY